MCSSDLQSGNVAVIRTEENLYNPFEGLRSGHATGYHVEVFLEDGPVVLRFNHVINYPDTIIKELSGLDVEGPASYFVDKYNAMVVSQNAFDKEAGR